MRRGRSRARVAMGAVGGGVIHLGRDHRGGQKACLLQKEKKPLGTPLKEKEDEFTGAKYGRCSKNAEFLTHPQGGKRGGAWDSVPKEGSIYQIEGGFPLLAATPGN